MKYEFYKYTKIQSDSESVICYSNELWLQSFFAVTLRLRGRSSRCSRECALSCDWLSVLTSLSCKQQPSVGNGQHSDWSKPTCSHPSVHSLPDLHWWKTSLSVVHLHLLLLLHPPLFFCGGLSASQGNNLLFMQRRSHAINTLAENQSYALLYICIHVYMYPSQCFSNHH